MADNTIEIKITAQDSASSVLKQVSDNLGNASEMITEISRGIGQAAQAVMAAIQGAVSASVTFNAAMTNVAAVLGQTRDQQAALTREVLDFGATAQSGPQAVAAAYYDIVGGVADASTHMAILSAAEATAEAGQVALQSTTQALISVMNSYKFSADQASFASDVLTRTVQVGVGTMGDFAAALPQVAGLAASVGISFDSLGGMMAFLTTKGVTASQAMTQVRGAITALLTPNKEMTTILSGLGYQTGQAAIKNLGLQGTLEALQREATRTGANYNLALGSIEAINGAVALSTSAAADAMNEFETGITGATNAAKEIQLTSAKSQLDLLTASIDALKISVGDALTPSLVQLVQFLTPVINGFRTFVQDNPQLVTAVLTVITVLGGLVTSMFTVIPMINAIRTAITALMAGTLGPVAIVVALVAAAFATNFGGIRDMFMESFFPVLQSLGELVATLFEFLKPLLKGIFELFGSTIGLILKIIAPFMDILKVMIDMVTGFIKLLNGDLNGAMQKFGAPANPMVLQAQAAQQRSMDAFNAAKSGGTSTLNSMTSGGSYTDFGIPMTPPNIQGTLPGVGGVVYDNPAALYAALQAAQSGQAGGMTINVQMPAAAMANPGAASQAGKEFGSAIYDELRRTG